MAANLVSVVMQFLTPDMIAKIASARALTAASCKATGGAVPALLASLADVAVTPMGSPAQQYTGAATDWGAREFQKPDRRLKARTRSRKPDRARCLVCSAEQRWTRWHSRSASSRGSTGQPASRYSVCSAPLVLGTYWVNSSAARAWMRADSRRFSARKRIRSPRPFWPPGLADQLSAAGLIDRAAGTLRGGAAAASAAGSRIAGASERTVAGTKPGQLTPQQVQHRRSGPIG